jgi:hypothetical protein
MERVGSSHDYTLRYAARLTGSLRADRLVEAVERSLKRHSALRTRLHSDDGELRQLVPVLPPGRLKTHYLKNQNERQPALDLFMAKPISYKSHELAQTLLLRDDESFTLALKVHHLIFDLWSWHVFMADVANCYVSDKVPEPLTYSDYAEWQQRNVPDSVYWQQLEFWRQLAQGHRGRGIPLGPLEGNAPDSVAATITWEIESYKLDQLRNAAKSIGCSLFILLLTTFHFAVGVTFGSNDTLIGSATANRTHPWGETVGFLANGRFSRLKFSRRDSFAESVLELNSQWRSGSVFSEAHLEQAVQDLGKPDLVNFKFSLNDAALRVNPPLIPGVSWASVGVPVAPTLRRDMQVTLSPQGRVMNCRVSYRPAIVGAFKARQLSSCYQQLLSRVAITYHGSFAELLDRIHQ